MMIRFHKLFSTTLGIGYIGKGGGTIAAVFCCLCWYFAQVDGNNYLMSAVVTIIITVAGIWSSGKLEVFWGKDSSRIVIDEVAGMCVTLLFVPVKWKYILIGLVLFRFFDIAKPLFIRKMEDLPLGWGVMMDDLLAGLYANLLLQLVVHSNLI